MPVAQTSLHGRKAVITNEGKFGALGVPHYVGMSAAASTANVSLVTLTVRDYEGNPVLSPQFIDVFLSDAATGLAVTAATASGAVAAGASGSDVETVTSKKHLRVQTNASGVYILSITDTAKTQFYVCCAGANMPFHVAGRVLTASYG